MEIVCTVCIRMIVKGCTAFELDARRIAKRDQGMFQWESKLGSGVAILSSLVSAFGKRAARLGLGTLG